MRDLNKCEFYLCKSVVTKYLVLLDPRGHLKPHLCAMCASHAILYRPNAVNHIFSSLEEAEMDFVKSNL